MRYLTLAFVVVVSACAHRQASEEPVAQPIPEEPVTKPNSVEEGEPEPPAEEADEAAPEAAAPAQPELGSTKYCGKFTPPNTQTMQTADLRKKKKCAAAKASAQQEGLLDNRDETCQASLEGSQAVCVELSGKAWSLWDASYPALRKVAECRCAK